jgi:hypothetical protein
MNRVYSDVCLARGICVRKALLWKFPLFLISYNVCHLRAGWLVTSASVSYNGGISCLNEGWFSVV